MSKTSKKPFRPAGKVSRLTFTEEERADPNLEKPLKKAEKAGDKLEKAQDKIPKKKSLVTKRTVDAKTGKERVHLYFEESDKPKSPSKLSHKLKTIPQRELLAKIHKEIREGEEDNVGVEAAHKTEQGGEFVANRVKSGYHSHKLKPYRQLARQKKRQLRLR